MSINLIQATLAVGALGTAATGLVDTTKMVSGGISRAGFGYIKQLIARMVSQPGAAEPGTGLTPADIRETLLANWMNGIETGAQKAIAKSFVKLHLNPSTAAALAKETNVDAKTLVNVALKLTAVDTQRSAPNSGLTPVEADTFGRFDLALSAMVDRAYERAGQLYRNSCKALACIIAVGLAFAGNCALPQSQQLPYWQLVIIGLIATPLAPVAKDIANAIQSASDAVGSVKG
jgi:hypothetical protein